MKKTDNDIMQREEAVIPGKENEKAIVQEKFNRLAAEWKTKSGPGSSSEQLAMHPAYQQIIGIGPNAVPLLLRGLEETPDHWFWALRAITGNNPVKPQNRGNLRLMADDWLQWAKERGYQW